MDSIQRFRAWLRGEPDTVLTGVLIGLALALVAVALWAPVELKALAAAWVILP